MDLYNIIVWCDQGVFREGDICGQISKHFSLRNWSLEPCKFLYNFIKELFNKEKSMRI